MSLRVLAVSVLSLALVAGASVASPPGQFKDLQVLPKSITKDELKAIMKAQSKALGVDCDHCHEMPEAEKDTKNKKIAREMMKMTKDINSKWLKKSDDKVVCGTCHNGHEKPEVLGK
jgi:hypothetical protein